MIEGLALIGATLIKQYTGQEATQTPHRSTYQPFVASNTELLLQQIFVL